MTPHKSKEWRDFRQQMVELSGHKCQACNRSDLNGAILQVHHKTYTQGRLPWEYGYDEVVILCKGCHAKEHAIIMPTKGWELIGEDDLGDLSGVCDYCGTEFRYSFVIQHADWPTIMEVGAYCCDELTGSSIASEFRHKAELKKERKKRFLQSPRWLSRNGSAFLNQAAYTIMIDEENNGFRLNINGTAGRKRFPKLGDAKATLFDMLENDTLANFFSRRRQRATQQS